MNAAASSPASCASTPVRVGTPAAASRSSPRPEAKGEGSSQATTTRATPARASSSAQEVPPDDRAPQGSSVT